MRVGRMIPDPKNTDDIAGIMCNVEATDNPLLYAQEGRTPQARRTRCALLYVFCLTLVYMQRQMGGDVSATITALLL